MSSDLIRQSVATEAIRAIESYREEQTRLYSNRVGVDLLPPIWRLFIWPMKFAIMRRPILWYRDRQIPGAIGSIICRTRFIDDVLKRELRDDVEQVVILGAGFDSRAYRIPGIENVAVFEIDHPESQALKKKRVEAVFGLIPAHVSFVPVDFETDELSESMAQSSYQSDRRTLFIWEGVTQYLTEAAVDSTLLTISTAAECSALVFTYITRGMIDGSTRSAAEETVVKFLSDQGTPWTFGIAPERIDEFLAERGLSLEEDVGAEAFQERYLHPHNRHMNLFEGERAVLAHVAGSQ